MDEPIIVDATDIKTDDKGMFVVKQYPRRITQALHPTHFVNDDSQQIRIGEEFRSDIETAQKKSGKIRIWYYCGIGPTCNTEKVEIIPF